MALRLGYFHNAEFRRFLFFRAPRILFEAVPYRKISFDARMFFVFLLDRVSLSARNGWVDETGRVYIFYTISAAMRITGYGHNKVSRIFSELEQSGLIERVRQGQGKPMKIYVKDLFHPMDEDGNPATLETVSLSPSEKALEGQMSFLPEMDATENHACEMAGLDEQKTVGAAGTVEIVNSLTTAVWTGDRSEPASPADDAADAAAVRDTEDETARMDTELPSEVAAPYCFISPSRPAQAVDLPDTDADHFPASPAAFDVPDRAGSILPSDMGMSGLPVSGSPDIPKSEPIQNQGNKNRFTKNPSYLSILSAQNRRELADRRMDEMEENRERVRDQIAYPILCTEHPLNVRLLNEYVELIAGVMSSTRSCLTVNREDHPTEEVRTQFERLDKEHISYVMECMGRTTTAICNPRAYILTALYNAPNTITAYYDAKVRHDMAQPSWYDTQRSRRAC